MPDNCHLSRFLPRAILSLIVALTSLRAFSAPFPAAVSEAVMDFDACRVLSERSAEPVEAAAIRELLGLGQAGEPAAAAKLARSRKSGEVLQYLLVFKQPVVLGTVLGGSGELRVLQPAASLPPEPGRAADWLTVEVQPNQSSPRFAPLPAGTKTRALLVTVTAPRDSRQSPFLRLLTPRLANHTPAAVANAESDYTTRPTASPPYTYDPGHLTRGYGEWISSGKDEKGINSRAPITDLQPTWFILSWAEARRVDGVLLQDNFGGFELQAFTGPPGINAVAATEQEWKAIRKFKPTQDGQRRWLNFEPVQTRALRLHITKTDEGPVARLAGFSVFTDLGEQPVPAIVKPLSAEPPLEIGYELAQAGKVTLVVDRADGTRVRNLLANTTQVAGKNSVAWDLKDEQGNYVPPGDYRWKAITHPPLELRYEMTAYPNHGSYFPERPAWLTGASGSGGWLADHSPPRSACVAGDRVFLGAPVSESGVSLIECDLEGRKQWGHSSFEAFTGSWLLASDGKTVFNLAPAHNFARAGMDKNTEAIWAVDIATKKVRTLAMLQPTAERKRGAQGLAAHDGKVFVAIHGAENWFQNAAGASDVDLQNSLPTYPVARKPRAAYEMVPDQRTDFLRLFRLKDQPPGFGPNHGLVHLETTKNPTRQQHVVLAFTKPVSIGSLVFPPPPKEDKMQFTLSVLKSAAPYPPRPDERADWVNVPLTDTNAWAVLPLPAGTSTRALRITFTRGGGGANDDLLSDIEDKKGAPALDLADKPTTKKSGFAAADDGLWQRRLEGMKLLGRRFENAFSTATVRFNSGKILPDGTWDAQRTEPLSAADPGIYALEWKAPQSLRGLALREVDGAVTEVDVFTGPANAPVDIKSDAGWEKVATYRQALRDYYSGRESNNGYARYLDGYVDFGREVSTRAVRLRVIKQWDSKDHYPSGIREDLGGQTLDTKRCRVFGVAALRYLGGEPVVNPLVTERVEMIDGETGKVLKEVHVPRIAEAGGDWSRGNLLAVNQRGEVFTIADEKLVQVDFNGAALRPLVTDLQKPSALACDRAGNFYVFDSAKERKNIRVYDATGKFLRSIGEPGGYQRGPWNQNRMDHITALAVDARDQVWAVDWNYWPKRISLWSADGKFQKEFLGPTEYGGAGQLDPGDKRRLFYGPLEFELDWASGKSRLKNLLSLDGHGASDSPIYVGKQLYLVNTRPGGHGPSQQCGVVYRHDGDRAKLVAAVGLAGQFKPLLDPRLVKAFGGKVLMDYICTWSDLNGDEQVQPEEVQLWPKPKNVRVVFDSQLGVQMGPLGFRVKEFRSVGVPVYERVELPGIWDGVALRLNDGNYYHFEDESALRNACAVQRPDGKVLWTYQTEGAGVQALTRAKPWHPAQIVCQFGFAGHATAHAGDLGEFLVFNSNVGIFNIMTADGMFAGQIFRDIRDPKALPWSGTNNARGMRLDDITPGQEHFQGYFTRTSDNKYYAVAGHNHASVVEVVGMDRFKRFEGNVAIGAKELAAAQNWERSREARVLYARAPVLDAYLMSAPKLDGKLNDWGPVSAEQDRDAKFRIGYDEQNLYLAFEVSRRGPLKNQGQQWDRLFKTGASVDLQIAVDPGANPDRKAPAPGDQRLLLTIMGDKPTAVLYQAVVPGTPPDKAWQVVSPVHSVTFDRVTKLDSVRFAVEDNDNGYVLEAAVPLAALGLKITPGLRLKMDWGILVSGPDGTEVLRREYWANKVTQITADAPSEAELHPELWGHVRFHSERLAALDPTAKKKDKAVEDLLNDLK